MKSTVEQLNPVQYRVHVEVSVDEVNKAFQDAYRKLQLRARIQGFRPGKAPLGIVRKFYGSSVTGEVHEALINTHLFKALGEQTFRPIASPVVEAKTAPVENQDFAFSAIVDVMPEITIADYKGVEVDAEVYTVKVETLERELTNLRRSHARTRPVEPGQVAAKGMVAAISHSATLDGKELASLDTKNMSVVLGDGELFPELEDLIVATAIGASKTGPVTLPESYGDKDLAGKTLTFTVTVNDLKHLDIPALDDEFAKDLSLESADVLKKNVEEHLANRAKDLGRQKLETAVLSKILSAQPFEVPPAMVDQVIDSIIQEELAQHPEAKRKEALRNNDLRQSLLETAKQRTQNTLLLWHVAQQEKIEVTAADVNTRLDEVLASSGITEAKQKVQVRKNIEPRIRENLMFELALELLIKSAKVTEIPTAL